MIEVIAARNATVVGNRVIGNVAGGIVVFRSVNTTVAKNHIVGSPKTEAASIWVGAAARNTKVVNNVVRSIPEGPPGSLFGKASIPLSRGMIS